MSWTIRKLYLYLASLIGLIIIIIASVNLVNLGLKTWVFTKAEDDFYNECERLVPLKEGREEAVEPDPAKCEEQKQERKTAGRQRDAATAVSMTVVGVPVWYYHWNKVKADKERENG